MIYSKKNQTEYFTDRMERQIENLDLKDQDFFIDIKLGSEKEIYNLYRAHMSNLVNEEHVFNKLTNPYGSRVDGREKLSFET